MSVTAQDVKALRDRTGAGMMECKAALNETGGDQDRATDLLRVRGQAKAAKRGERQAAEGAIGHYVHFNGRVGALVEVNCETDFVARNEEFLEFTREIAVHVASAAPRWVSEEDVPEDEVSRERAIFEQQADSDKPEEVRKKIAEGRLRKWLEEVVLLNQKHVNTDRYEGRTIEQLRADLSAKTGENVVIRRFARFQVGE
ncbi:MAG: translation elongation factor Ts [Solirubrobacterales bacterium]